MKLSTSARILDLPFLQVMEFQFKHLCILENAGALPLSIDDLKRGKGEFFKSSIVEVLGLKETTVEIDDDEERTVITITRPDRDTWSFSRLKDVPDYPAEHVTIRERTTRKGKTTTWMFNRQNICVFMCSQEPDAEKPSILHHSNDGFIGKMPFLEVHTVNADGDDSVTTVYQFTPEMSVALAYKVNLESGDCQTLFSRKIKRCDEGRVETITTEKRTWHEYYNSHNILTKRIDGGELTEFIYTPNHVSPVVPKLLVEYTQLVGKTQLVYTYDTLGRCLSAGEVLYSNSMLGNLTTKTEIFNIE